MAQASAWPRELREVGESAAKVECLVLKLTALKNKGIELDAKRQKNKAALAELRRHGAQTSDEPDGRVWLWNDAFFMKTPAADAEKSIRDEEAQLSKEIETVRVQQKAIVASISELAQLTGGSSGLEASGIDAAGLKLLLKQ